MRWIKVEDKLPEEGELVLSYSKDGEYRIDYLIICEQVIWACVIERDENKITHWMPLPKFPTG